MKDESRAALVQLGMDIDQTLARFVGNEGLLFKFVKRFPDEPTYGKLVAAMESGDTTDGFHQAHTLKGVVGNLGLGNLFDAVSPLVESLRLGDADQAKSEFPAVEASYKEAIDIILALTE